jgi:quercetin dioxygenase-like cupin family protein
LLHDRWPIEFFKAPKPPCILVRGSIQGNVNHIVPGPPANPGIKSEAISTLIEHIDCSQVDFRTEDFRSFSLVNGPSPEMRLMKIHYSVLAPEKSPHPPHVHEEEEILIVIKGEAELQVEIAKGSNQLKQLTAHPGDFIYYPGNWRHTIKNTPDTPVVYLMFKWISDEYHSDHLLDCVFKKSSDRLVSNDGLCENLTMEVILEGKTSYLRKLQAHITQTGPKRGYDPHENAYDVGIVLFEGKIETLGEEIKAPALIYYAAGEPHGLKCTSHSAAKYMVFEFHGKHGDIYEHPKFRRRRKLKQSLTNPRLLFNHLKWVIRNRLGK